MQGGKEEKHGDVVIQLLGREVSGLQPERRSGSCKPRGNMRSGFETENGAVWSEGDGQKEEVRLEVLAGHKESRIAEGLSEDWCEEAVEDGFGPCESGEG